MRYHLSRAIVTISITFFSALIGGCVAAPTAVTPMPQPTPSLQPIAAATAPPAAICPTPRDVSLPKEEPFSDDMLDMITAYLSLGGSPQKLETVLQSWVPRKLKQRVQVISADLTGDDIPEIILTEPYSYFQHPTVFAGPVSTVDIFGCADGRYSRIGVLYGVSWEEDHDGISVQDSNADGLNDLAVIWSYCGVGICTSRIILMQWIEQSQFFSLISNTRFNTVIQGTITLRDIDGDGTHEIVLQTNGEYTSLSIGPRRAERWVVAWNSHRYRLLEHTLGRSDYLIHAVNDADEAFARGEISQALDLYIDARTDPNLLVWPLAYPDSEHYQRDSLAAYVTFKRVVGFVLIDQDDRALQELARLRANSPIEASTGYGFRQMAEVFWQTFKETDSPEIACQAVIDYTGQDPEAYEILNAYGHINPFYTPRRLCPY